MPLHMYRLKHAMFVWSLETILPFKWGGFVMKNGPAINADVTACGFRVSL